MFLYQNIYNLYLSCLDVVIFVACKPLWRINLYPGHLGRAMFVVVMFEISALETLYSGLFILSTRFKKTLLWLYSWIPLLKTIYKLEYILTIFSVFYLS